MGLLVFRYTNKSNKVAKANSKVTLKYTKALHVLTAQTFQGVLHAIRQKKAFVMWYIDV